MMTAAAERARAWLGAAALAAFATIAQAQEIEVPDATDRIRTGSGATLRGLDKVAGTTQDITLSSGDSRQVGHLVVMLEECRYPAENPAGEAYAWIDIFDTRADEMIFSGWMIASSPALNALDHARYDVWVLNCNTS